ncbi:hypothetical protein OSB04_003227 [Centaurea solstitialis]|uniref:Integrase catalytic domain-containing protein n=1 Tax=Centaurea solstitialis TaxID=347529 RepID=A0AA38WVM1_9ASTR|nr:hypothetical protein OSB04_003227 [Centaurea solstitialis]
MAIGGGTAVITGRTTGQIAGRVVTANHRTTEAVIGNGGAVRFKPPKATAPPKPRLATVVVADPRDNRKTTTPPKPQRRWWWWSSRDASRTTDRLRQRRWWWRTLGLEESKPWAPTFKPQAERGEKTLRYRVVPTRVHPVQNDVCYYLLFTPEESLRLIMGKWKLTGQNFPVWKMHLDNVLDAQGKRYVIEKPISRPGCNAPEKDFAEYFKYMADEFDVMSILSFSTSPEFTADLRVRYCHEVVKNIENQVGFYKKSGKYLIMKEIYSLKLEKSQSVKDHLLEMRKLFKSLSCMGYKMVQEELVHLMWFSLTDEIRNTVSAYIGEPKRNVAKLHEDILASLEPKPAAPAELMDADWIDELGDLSCPECGSKDICAHSMDIDQLDIGLPDAPGIFIIDCLITSYESWVLDTGSGNHICNHLQGFNRRETLRKDRSNLRVGEGTMLVAEAVGSYSLSLPSGLVLELENSTLSNGLYVLNLQENKEVYHISKRSKEIEDQTYLWHCRLGHINKKRIETLQKGGLLGSFDFKPFDNCESCLFGKMTKQPFNKDNERASEMLGIIHTDVCGPFSHVARGGYRYFITFTDDFSRYGYVYLIRHKSEAFERFKEFQYEVQNQLDRKIKFLRSDRGGEYLSQEFDNHLMECGIVSQLTPPYTPQMNGVSERRNRTLLDMVRSMMCRRSSLPVSFWGHALETTAHILNKVPTKSVESVGNCRQKTNMHSGINTEFPNQKIQPKQGLDTITRGFRTIPYRIKFKRFPES